MKKLTPIEVNACRTLLERGPLTPGEEPGSVPHDIIKGVLDSLVRKKRATVEMTDDGPRYSLTAQGETDAC
jgi:hypothetical protein